MQYIQKDTCVFGRRTLDTMLMASLFFFFLYFAAVSIVTNFAKLESLGVANNG